MATRQYLAMTAGEIAENPWISPGICWMACHFSSGGRGLSNLPRALPEGSVLILDDSIPIAGHDPELIVRQLEEQVRLHNCVGLLLDFQRKGQEELTALAEVLSRVLPCPVAVSAGYARNLSVPVFLPPVPPSVPLRDHFSPWEGRDIWLELGLDGEEILLTEQGCTVTCLPRFQPSQEGHREEGLHCRYTIEKTAEGVRFILWRTQKDLLELVEEAEGCGVTAMVGLFQELPGFLQPNSSPFA